MYKDIFTWKRYEQIGLCISTFVFFDTEFVKDFGVFRRGDKVDLLTLSFDEGSLTSALRNARGDLVEDMEQKFACMPVDPEITVKG